ASGIGTVFEPHALQRAFVDEGAVQCGFCTPGMIVAAKTLLDEIAEPTDAEVKEALDGNLCRCTGYVKPLKAVHTAARAMRDRQAR
ncbi:MAG: 2Fe-2S iron-sulfur cluster-binding protein, partial [Myxococcota bacterium]